MGRSASKNANADAVYAMVSIVEVQHRGPRFDNDPSVLAGAVQNHKTVKMVGRIANVVGDPHPSDRVDTRRANQRIVCRGIEVRVGVKGRLNLLAPTDSHC